VHIHIENVTITTPGPELADIESLLQRLASSSHAAQPAAATAGAPRIGEVWAGQGGVYAGVARYPDGDYHLVVADAKEGERDAIKWGGYGDDEPNATSDIDGKANTLALVGSQTQHPAAEWAAGLSIGGHQDWYLPSRRELRLAWVNVPELFQSAWYWTSTQISADAAWYQGFDDGTQNGSAKSGELRARAVRRFKAQ